MKRIIKYTIALSVAVLLSSCGNDWLNLKKDDSFSSTQDLMYEDLVSLQVGMYNAIQYSTDYYGAKMIYSGDVKGDDFQYNSDGGASKTDDEFLYTFTKDNAVGCWVPAYYLIKAANAVIDAKVENEKDYEEEVKDLRGQGYFMRALAHFDLLRQYGEFYNMDSEYGIPVVDKTIPGGEFSTYKPKRSSVKDTYTAIVTDLKDHAIPMMGEERQAGFANRWAAKALLCRVYLYMGENRLCLELANDIINNGPYRLFEYGEYEKAWTQQGNSESLFEVVNTEDDNMGYEGIGYLMAPKNYPGYGDMIPTLQYVRLFSDDDIRKKLFLFVEEGSYPKNFMVKFKGTTVSAADAQKMNTMTTSIWVLRLAEVYLNGAEAAVKLGDSQANNLLQELVDKRYASGKAPVVSGANLERVLLERRLELGGEGFRFYDALRNNKTMYRDNEKYKDEIIASGVTYDWTDFAKTVEDNEMLHTALQTEFMEISRNSKKAVMPIPIGEINLNKNTLTQYPTWE